MIFYPPVRIAVYPLILLDELWPLLIWWGILSVMEIDPSISATPFANVKNVSYDRGEEEVPFSMHSVICIGKLKQIDETDRLFQIDLTLTGDNNPQLHDLTECMWKETFPDQKEWHQFGEQLIKIRQFDTAQQVFDTMFDQTTEQREKADIYHMLATVKYYKRESAEAIRLYKNQCLLINNQYFESRKYSRSSVHITSLPKAD